MLLSSGSKANPTSSTVGLDLELEVGLDLDEELGGWILFKLLSIKPGGLSTAIYKNNFSNIGIYGYL